MKRVLVFLLAMLLAAQGCALAEETMVVTGGWLRLREAADYDAAVLSRHFTGTRVTVLQKLGMWYQVQLTNGSQGWMNAAYLAPSDDLTGTEAVIISANGGSVNLRSGPGTSYPVKATLSPGTPVQVSSLADAWCYVTTGSMSGYVKRTYLGAAGAEQTVRYVTSENGGSVHLRRGQGRDTESHGLYPVGTQVVLLSAGEQWSYVSINGKQGYMMNRYLTQAPALTASSALQSVSMSSTQPRAGQQLGAVLSPYSAQAVYVWTDDAGRVLGSGLYYIVTQDDVGQRLRVTAIGYGTTEGAVTSRVSSPVAE